jgi:hypothetical protein
MADMAKMGKPKGLPIHSLFFCAVLLGGGGAEIAICLVAYNIYILYIYALIASFGSSAMRVLGQSVIITTKYRKIEKFCQGYAKKMSNF